MWHSDHEHTDEEIKVLRELEYDLFMFDAGFRQLWNNDFEAYFRGLFDERAWKNKMLADREFAEFMKEQAIIDEVLSGELKPEQAPIEMRQELEQLLAGQETNEIEEILVDDPLYLKADDWAVKLSKQVGPLYEQFGDIKLFRVLTNCYIVAGKIVFAKLEDEEIFPKQNHQWRPDRVGYTLALTSLRRCLESLEKLKKNLKIAKRLNIASFLKTAKSIQTELIDRLDEIEQQRLKM